MVRSRRMLVDMRRVQALLVGRVPVRDPASGTGGTDGD